MAELPTGTVTLLFSDIEGSTRLLERLGDRYVEVLAEHRRLLRASFARFNGREVGTEGDAFFIAFDKASEAVAAAVAAQSALAAHPWPDGAVMRVRMGIHTGEPIVVGQDYAGLDVHRAARICSAAHGGQVLLSQPTRVLLGNDLPSGVELRDLGEHRLKDLPGAQRLFQLVMPGLPSDFPALRTVGSQHMNLPVQLTSFVGRQRELAQVKELLERPGVRLLTLSGPGGSGKSRLAVQVASELAEAFPDGVCFVGLAPVSDPELVLPTIAQALGVRGAAGQALLHTLAEQVGDRRQLLLLDNFEQILAAAGMVVDLLAACPRLQALVTSRAALQVSGEHAYPLPPLSLPNHTHAAVPDDITSSEAVRLFVERAQALNPDFAVTDANAPVLAEICRRLDGLPLAIELAAARSRLLPPQALLARLESRLQLLRGGSRDLPARQQTLRATIDWSYALLEADEQALLARLAIFAGGCTLEAAEVVCNLEGDLDVLGGLDALVNKNLLQPRDDVEGERRVVLLETMREYALERLSGRGEADVSARRHADYFLGLAEQAEPELLGPRQGVWYERLEADLDNFRAALAWFLAHEQAEATARLAATLMPLWWSRGHASEGLRWLDAVLERRGSLAPPALAKALLAKAGLLLEIGDHHGQAPMLLEESLALFQQLKDTTWTVRAVSRLGWAIRRAGELDRGLALHEQAVALAREQTDTWSLALALNNLGYSLLQEGDYVRARAMLEESRVLCEATGEPEGIAAALQGLAEVALVEGHHTQASSMLEQALTLARKIGHVSFIGRFLVDLGIITLHQGDQRRAATLFEEALGFTPRVEDELLIGECLWGLGAVAVSRGQPVRAVRLWGAATALGYPMHVRLSATRLLEERLLALTEETLGRDAFQAEWATGQAMRREDAITFALANDGEVPYGTAQAGAPAAALSLEQHEPEGGQGTHWP
jgi:predicted ATPase/class 3 adenylate cyclase